MGKNLKLHCYQQHLNRLFAKLHIKALSNQLEGAFQVLKINFISEIGYRGKSVG
jgi:hypothetical protein